MTSGKWSNSISALEMLQFVPLIGERKWRLLACAHARRVWHLLCPQAQEAIKVAEKFADGEASMASLEAAKGKVDTVIRRFPRFAFKDHKMRAQWEALWASYHALNKLARVAANGAASLAEMALHSAAVEAGEKELYYIPEGNEEQANLLREVIGNPFLDCQPVLQPEWRTPEALATARAVYNRPDETGKLSQAGLNRLASLLELAGCGSTQILGHLREPGNHVRGCWAIDLVLGH